LASKTIERKAMDKLRSFERLDAERREDVTKHQFGGMAFEGLLDRLERFMGAAGNMGMTEAESQTFGAMGAALARMRNEREYAGAFEDLCSQLHVQLKRGAGIVE
jgi:hypothetical protein